MTNAADSATQTAARADYVARVNRVMDYVEDRLDAPLSLEVLSRVACFSPHHLHRVFAAVVGETPQKFVQRLRVERAAMQLIQNPALTITEISLACGFSSPATFARSFKAALGTSATEWRAGAYQNHRSDVGMTVREQLNRLCADHAFQVSPIATVGQAPAWRVETPGGLATEVLVRELPDVEVAYVRHIGAYRALPEVFAGLFDRLLRWARARDLLRSEPILLSAYRDLPQVTREASLRVDACLSVPAEVPADGEIGRRRLPGGRYAVGHFELETDGFERAWYAMIWCWLPESGYQLDDRPP